MCGCGDVVAVCEGTGEIPVPFQTERIAWCAERLDALGIEFVNDTGKKRFFGPDYHILDGME